MCACVCQQDAEMGELKQELMQQELMQQELIKQELIKQDLIHIPTPPHTNLDPGHHTYETDVIQAQELPLPHTTDEVILIVLGSWVRETVARLVVEPTIRRLIRNMSLLSLRELHIFRMALLVTRVKHVGLFL